MSRQLETAVAFIIFNRPDTTERVFAEIAKAKPPKLFVIADGPRLGHPTDSEDCTAARAIVDRVDWNCEVLANFSPVNLGCKRRVSSGLDWVFDTVEKAIILEDDCVPHPTFFRFCEELLEQYQDDERVVQINGVNFQLGRKRTEYSYYFSRYNHIWGWASWRRAWKNYDVDMRTWPEIKKGRWLRDLLVGKDAVRYWTRMFDKVFHGHIDTWDYQWTFACWIHGGLSIAPHTNIISNIGFSQEATHTKKANVFSALPHEPMLFPLRHPPFVIRDAIADDYTCARMFNRGLFRRIAQDFFRKA